MWTKTGAWHIYLWTDLNRVFNQLAYIIVKGFVYKLIGHICTILPYASQLAFYFLIGVYL